MSSLIRVAILEDHQIVADGYSFRLQGTPEFEIVGCSVSEPVGQIRAKS